MPHLQPAISRPIDQRGDMTLHLSPTTHHLPPTANDDGDGDGDAPSAPPGQPATSIERMSLSDRRSRRERYD
jgi:hypothetical protein